MIGALVFVDIVQAILSIFAIGIVINRGINFIVGITWSFYLQIRDEKLVDTKRLLGVLGAFGIEMIPLIDILPAWTLSGIYNMVLAKRRDKEAEKEEGKTLKIEKEKKMEAQAERSERIQQVRQQQEDQRREEQRLASQRETEQNALEDNDEDLYDRAA